MSTLVHAITYNVHGLPWVATPMEKIICWLLEIQVPIICFQEVFTTRGREILRERLRPFGYTVLFPRDEGVTLFPSGLVTAIHHGTYRVVGAAFRPFLDYHNVEIFANKGFHRIHLEDVQTGRRFHVINTHTQSDEEVMMWTRYAFKKAIRFKQAAQMLAHCEEEERLVDPVLVVGDFNQESSLHPHLRTLHPPSTVPMRKATFFSTGEDLDHVAWMPTLWHTQRPGCGFCGIEGPVLDFCKVHDVDWSDHAPVEMKVRIPE
jgi:endonuclease/exonuclease/phosphatase family metal-dependent hydrolase